jgi:hypothetical protein
VGFENSWDCLMENVKTRNMRHAPCLEWGSSGCVIRNSTFINSDAQCHSGWCHENLFENCVVVRPSGHGAYGHGFYTTSPTDSLHGPIGPRNVIYNCDFRKVPAHGLVLNGMNENWIVLHNRFESGREGILMKRVNFDHVIANNVFVTRGGRAMIRVDVGNPSGIEVRSNHLYSSGKRLLSGNTKGIEQTDNVLRPPARELPARPKPKVPSIFEWQRRNRAKGAGGEN